MSRYGFTTKVAGVTIASAHMNAVQTGVEAAVSGTGFFFTSGGAGNAYTGALTPAVDAYANARLVLMKANHTNTGAATLNLDSVGATAIKKTDGATDVASGDIVSGQTYLLSYNGTSWCLVGGGGGGTAVYPWLVQVPIFTGSASNTNWDTIFANTAVESELIGNGMLTSSGGVNDEIVYKVLLAAGTWTLRLMHWADVNRGRYEVFFDASTPTSLSGSANYIEGYAASDTPNTRNTITGIVIPSTAVYSLKLKMASKHASATDYYGCIQELALIRTA